MSAFKQDVRLVGPNPRGTRGESSQINANTEGTKLIYGAGRTMVVRDYANPALCQLYSAHKKNVRVAKFNNAGTTLVSCDEAGACHLTQIKKSGLIEATKVSRALGGAILDIVWAMNDKKLALGGEAKPSGRCMTVSGLDQGSMGESSKRLMSVDARPDTSNMTWATGSYDGLVRLYAGPSPKISNSVQASDSKKPVENVKYSPDGKHLLVTAGKEMKMLDPESGEILSAFPVSHSGTIYGLQWSPDSKHVMTSSADTTVKLWDVATQKDITTFDCTTTPDRLDNFQVGCCYAAENMVSLSLCGNILYLDPGSGKVSKVVEAHSGPVASITSGGSNFFSIDKFGGVHSWGKDHIGKMVRGSDDKPLHSKSGKFVSYAGDMIYTSALDNRLRVTGADGKKIASIGLTGPCVGLDAKGTTAAAASKSAIYVLTNGKPSAPLEISYEASACALSPEENEVAIGDGKQVRLYKLAGGELAEIKAIPEGGLNNAVTCLDYSKDMIAIGTATKYVRLFERSTGAKKDANRMCFNTSKISCVKFSPDGSKIASVSQDGSCYIYSVADPSKRVAFQRLHDGGIASVAWLSDTEIATSGITDGAIKLNTVES